MLGTAAVAAPSRVVSTNVCTDQIAMMLAAPGQLVSVSFLARDPRSSAMADAAAAFPANSGGAEEVYLLAPDLVLAGTYSTRGAVDILRRLGIEVRELPPARSLADVRTHILRVGSWMGRSDAAREIVAAFNADLEALQRASGAEGRIALYGPNGYTAGAGTLAHEIVALAGFDNIAAEVGLPAGGVLALERLVLAAPDALLSATPYAGQSQAEAILSHPALAHLDAVAEGGLSQDAGWSCETPHVLQAVRELRAAMRARGQAP